MKASTLLLFTLCLTACGVARPILESDNTKVEVKVVEKIVKDTAWFELPVIVEKVATLDTASVLENKYAKSEAVVTGGVLHHSLATKPVREPVVDPPALAGIENPSSATIVCQGDTFTFALDQALADNGGIFLVIEATEGQSNGVSRAHAKASAVKLVEEPTDAAIDIRADYVAKYGAPSAAAPKIFFRYYFVNSSTGEKSGTMLAECKWEAAAAQNADPAEGEGGGD